MKHTEEIRAEIDKISIAPSARSALFKVTSNIFEQMQQKRLLQSVPLPRRIATAAFLACDSKACIAIPKLKLAFGDQIVQKHISKARISLKIHHGTAHEKLDSLCKVCEISDTVTISRAHQYVDFLREAGTPSNVAVASLYVADNQTSGSALTQREMRDLTGCTEATLRSLSMILLRRSEEE